VFHSQGKFCVRNKQSPFGRFLCFSLCLIYDHICIYINIYIYRAADEMLKKGIDPDSPEAQLFGRKLLRSLTDVFGRCILETGFFHAGE